MVIKGYKDALTSLWDGVCDVYAIETVRNEGNGRDEPTEALKLSGQPCRLSFSNVSSTSQKDGAPIVQQTVKLFIAKDADIPAGSKIVVTQEGKTAAYKRSGEPATYSNHQEIVLEPFKEYA